MAQSVKSVKRTSLDLGSQASVPLDDSAFLPVPLEVFPEEIVFKDIETDQTYEVTVCVRNLAPQVRRIRFIPPQTGRFGARYEALGALAVGIATNVVVTFETDQLGDFHDQMVIQTEGFSVDLPLHAYQSRPEVRFDPFVNLGFTTIGRPATGSISFLNEGSAVGEVVLKYEKLSELTLTPETFTLQPKEERTVEVSYVSKEVSTYRCAVDVEVAGQPAKHIDISANCVEQQVALVASSLAKGETDTKSLSITANLDFQTLYYGQKKEIQAFLVNVGPFPVRFYAKFTQGSEENDAETSFMTPIELANQSIRRIITARPISGQIQPFSQLPISFTCAPVQPELTTGFSHSVTSDPKSRNFSQTSPSDSFSDYFYTALFDFEGLDQRLSVQIQARAVLPSLKLSENTLHFYDCPVNQQRDAQITLENRSDDLPLDYQFEQIAHFGLSPACGVLQPMQKKPVFVTFRPRNLGVFEGQAKLVYLKGGFSVNLTLYGECSSVATKATRPRGPEGTKKDFSPVRQYFLEGSSPGKGKKWALNKTLTSSEEKNYLRESRKQRISAIKGQRLAARSQVLPKTFEEIEKNTDFTLSSAPIPTKMLMLPPPKDQLYVEKAMGKYDPGLMGALTHVHDPNKPIKNVLKRPVDRKKFEEIAFSQKATTQAEVKDCLLPLNPADLSQISAGPKELNFEKVVIRAETGKWFSVFNDLKQCIYVEMATASEEIQRVEPASLVIPPGQKGGFHIVLFSSKKQHIQASVRYLINSQYEFFFKVTAEVEPAVLELALPDPTSSAGSPLSVAFKFEDESLEQTITKAVVVVNKCNAQTKFTWTTLSESPFTVDPIEDLIDAGKHRNVTIKYTPGAGKSNEETLIMKVENGESQTLICRGEITTSECIFTQKSLDFGLISVGTRVEKTVSLKNNKPKYAVFHVTKCPEHIEVTPGKGRIVGDGKYLLKVRFLALTATDVSGEVEVSIRGGKVLKLALAAKAILPRVSILEPDIDFGGVTIGSLAARRFSLVNDSPIPAVLYLNLEDHPEFDLSLPPSDTDAESAILLPATHDKDSPFYLKDEEEDLDDPKPDMDEDASQNESSEEEEEIHRKFKVTLSASRTVVLQLNFSPKEAEPYQFLLPFFLSGLNQALQGLQRTVNGEGLKPRFYVEKSIIDFEKKVISLQDKSFPVHRSILISNPELYSVKWRLDCGELDRSLVFAIKPDSGVLEPGNFSHLQISFNPVQAISHESKVNLFLDDGKDPYLVLTLKGEGTVPRVTFDRREVVLPVVPLGITAKSLFYLVNDGYENVELDYKIVQDAVKLDLSLVFPEGRQLGVTRQKLPVEVVFSSNSTISFTNRVDFLDFQSNRFSITVSGTADNSLLSVYPFIQRNADEIQFTVSDSGLISLIQEVQSDSEVASDAGMKVSAVHRTSGGSSVVSRSARSIIGFNPVPQPLLEHSLDLMARWMNHSVLSTPVTKLPDDIIEANGAQIYELIYALSGKHAPGQAKLQGVPSRDQAKRLTSQYDSLLKWLKESGALLSTIRPEYLLNMSDFSRYLKSTPEQLQLKPRQVERRWPYLSIDAWVTLLCQIIRLFCLSRVTPKAFKSLPGTAAESTSIEAVMTQSNIYSLQENILLKWLSTQFAAVFPMTAKKVRNFDQDLLDGTVFAGVIQSYVGGAGSLAKVKYGSLSEEQKRGNIEKVLTALNEIGMPTFLVLKDLTANNVSAREMVLFCLTLFLGLPNYIPKATIEFPCVLGERVTKTVELTNPSNKPITYWVKLEGSPDFVLEHPDEFSIEPKSSELFPIHFQSRIFSSISARLRLTSRVSETSARAAALVFQLVSKVHSRKSEKTVEIEGFLYEVCSLDVEVRNPFPKDAEFQVSIIYPEPEVPPPPKKSTLSKSKSPFPALTALPKAFYLKSEHLKVKKNASSLLSVYSLPFTLDKTDANLVFSDESVGEMQYSLVGNVKLPRSDKQDRFDFKREVGSTEAVELAVGAGNHLLDTAKREALGRFQAAAKAKEREALKELFKSLIEEISVFDVEINSPFFSSPPTLTLLNPGRKGKGLDTTQASGLETSQRVEDPGKGKKQGSVSRLSISVPPTESGNGLVLGFAPRQPGEYPCQVILTNALKTDIRVLEVNVSVKPRKAKLTLEMTTFARLSLSQEIPITNNSDKDWSIRTRLTQESDFFQASKDFVVRKRSSGGCLVTFKPDWVCETAARLEIEVISTGEVYEFEISGKCKEPRAEKHLILPCKVKEYSKHRILVPNPLGFDVIYIVSSDLSNASGDSTIEVPANGVSEYVLTLYPLQSGVYTGSITFTDPQSRYYWYTLEVQSATPEPESTKELRTQCRKAVEFCITVFNPLLETAVFQVNTIGEGLFGPAEFPVEAKETGIYQLVYSPLKIDNTEGSISFISEKTGEFWYKLRLICDSADPIEPDMYECPLGKSTSRPISLENPSALESIVDCLCSNPANFEVIPDRLIIPAYGSVNALIKYTPTGLESVESGEIALRTATIGDWVYRVRGKGLPPEEMETMVVTAGIGESSSVQIPFKNPFRETLNVSISLETSRPSAFQLLLRRAKFPVISSGMLMIPLVFKPEHMEELHATLLVSASPELVWVYPIRGITERPSFKTDFVFKTKCRNSLERTVDVHLPDLAVLMEEENFSHELQVDNTEAAHLVGKYFSITPVKNIIAEPSEALQYQVKFTPLRPFRTEAELFIYKSSGGRWKFNLIIEAKEGNVDDTITIEAAMGRPASIRFRLPYKGKLYTPFQAVFSQESDPCFSVFPLEGLLEPYSKLSTPFTVSFTPTEYGAPKTAKLLIITEDMQWTYAIRGTHPHYKLPDVRGGRIDNRLSLETQERLNTSLQVTNKKNFVRENLRKTQFQRSTSELRRRL